MKRAADEGTEEEYSSKVCVMETPDESQSLVWVNRPAATKKPYIEHMELCESVSNLDAAVFSNTINRLDVIGQQMKHLKDLMHKTLEEGRFHSELHQHPCNFVKKPGHIYHLYEKGPGQRYFGMLSPEEWQGKNPHTYLGSYRLEADKSWTAVSHINERYDGLNFLQNTFGIAVDPKYALN